MSKYEGGKPKYEAPAVMALGELASAVGQTGSCGPGTVPGGHCGPGTGGSSSCGPGTTPGDPPGTGECVCGDGPSGCSPGVGGQPQPVDKC
jgi:hypothetical protein